MSRVKNNKQKSIQDTKTCTKCLKPKKPKTDFYMSYSIAHADGRLPICKQCISEIAGEDYKDIQTALRMVDRPWLPHLWKSALEDKRETLGAYFVLINAKDFRHMTWADSVFNENEDNNPSSIPKTETPATKEQFVVTDEIMEKWGYGFTDQEYMFFEKKYNFVKNNYPERTALHSEALKDWVIKKVKEDLAIAHGDIKEAKEWSKLASEAAVAAKINPNQLSKSDLSDGLDTFGQLVRTVEQAVDIIPILPKFKERPQDKVDFTIWCYVNYIRDLKGLPPVEYEEIYRFYEERKKEYEQRYGDLENDYQEVMDA
jgi:hypothetical protein